MEKIITRRYVFDLADNPGQLCVKYVSEIPTGHELFIKGIMEDENVLSCIFEYVGEIDVAATGFVTTVKVKEENCEAL